MIHPVSITSRFLHFVQQNMNVRHIQELDCAMAIYHLDNRQDVEGLARCCHEVAGAASPAVEKPEKDNVFSLVQEIRCFGHGT